MTYATILNAQAIKSLSSPIPIPDRKLCIGEAEILSPLPLVIDLKSAYFVPELPLSDYAKNNESTESDLKQENFNYADSVYYGDAIGGF